MRIDVICELLSTTSHPLEADRHLVALLAVGGTLTAIEKTLDGTVDTAYALVRPERF